MKKLRFQFLLFSVLLIFVLGFFISKAFVQIHEQNLKSWEKVAERTFNQMQVRISDFLVKEDSKTFEDYQFQFKPKRLTQDQQDIGVLGYFQIDAAGKFQSQFVNLDDEDKEVNEKKHEALKQLSANLMEKPQLLSTPATPKKLEQQYVQLNTKVESAPKVKARKKKSYYKNRKNFYANPFESLRSGSGDSADAGAAQSVGKQFEEVAVKEALDDLEADLLKDADIMKPVTEGVLLSYADPFQARLIDNKYLLFYRKAWHRNQMYNQGFVVQANRFFEWLFRQSYEDTDLPSFTAALVSTDSKILGLAGRAISSMPDVKFLFKRSFGYPLSKLDLRFEYRKLPRTESQTFLQVLTAVTTLVLGFALLLLYRSTGSQVQLAQKKEDFVSAVTHELKTPLTSIRLSSEMLNQGWIKEPEKQKEHYEMLLKESERLSRLIENVLSLARLEKKTYQLSPSSKSPVADFQSFAKEFQTLVEQEGFTWQANCEENLPNISYDSDALKQILYNLVENSIKFSRNQPKKSVEMKLFKDGAQVVWQIADRGPGIDPKHLKKVFEKFYRAENEKTRQTKGSGIGLSLVKSLSTDMGAEIQIQNRKAGGLCVSLQFST